MSKYFECFGQTHAALLAIRRIDAEEAIPKFDFGACACFAGDE